MFVGMRCLALILTSLLFLTAFAQEEKKQAHYLFVDASIVWLGNIDNPLITGSLGWERSFRERRSIRYGISANYTYYDPFCDFGCLGTVRNYYSLLHHWKFQWVDRKYEIGFGASYAFGLCMEQRKYRQAAEFSFPMFTSRLDLYLTTGKLIPWVSIEPFVGGYAIVNYDPFNGFVELAGIQLPIFSLRLNFHLQR